MKRFSQNFMTMTDWDNHIEVKDNVQPAVTPVRIISHGLKPKLEKEPKQMVDLDIIDLIEKPTDWVNSLVIVEKSNWELNICLDPWLLDNAIKHEHLQLPIPEEIF